MIVNELTYYELKNVLEPIVQLKPMSYVVKEIGKVLKISEPTREKIQQQSEFHLRYKGFEINFYTLKWLRSRGACISLQFRRQSTKVESFFIKLFPNNNRLMDLVCGDVIEDLKKICTSEIEGIKFASTIVNGHSSFGGIEEIKFRVAYPNGAYNFKWNDGFDIAPLMISNEFHSEKWFISFTFNPGGFIRTENRTMLRDDWEKFASDISKSTKDWLDRNYHPNDARNKTYEEWSEDMILELGDEIIPNLPKIWN